MASERTFSRPENRLVARLGVGVAAATGVFALLWAMGAVGAIGFLTGVAGVGLLGLWSTLAFRHDLQSARREAAARLRTRLAKSLKGPLRAHVVEGVADPLLLLSPDKEIRVANRAARQLFGDHIEGRAVALHLRDPAALEAIDEAIELGASARLEVAFSRPADRTHVVSIARVENHSTAQPRLLGFNEPDFYIVVTFHDITQAKLAEQMRVDFVANASHELRTPLSSLIGFIETLESMDERDPEAQARFLSIMHSEADRMVRVIDDLLSLSRIELDRHVQPRGRVDLARLIDDVLKSQTHDAEARHMTLEADLPGDLPAVRGDRDQLFQVFQNLVRNAIKYANEGSTVTVRGRPLDRVPESGEPGASVQVIDRGEGIPEEHLPRLTERFYRVDTARSRRIGGTGLGLAIVKHIVTRHRGNLTIASTLGQGTTVTVSLPLFEPAASDARQREPAGAA
ncbi:two-component system phosphate regulon sensor histidine kinase PhoR [Rhodothalassium salexigens DSM 2132]|uniref:histidine kinase n=1 Tax=Rhodothalassium salexigens DSM 2132 TaxID=1188247 RepID=A0A4R2PQC5_RHOSA|nr:ATP-binding protein [Rhodothalassium salexigens]MBB4210556.1 two-component system phosphate regulon sensor histidine kinase PhoR [Rhodothalassium salexigens DSM 2132]MBK1638035.1 hypothetical protein [Rhodothalassium salexigens DSM 2132]TCP37887.1 two-component system phosphate regulon sensor histidine kinase PhoR [Rhodothalassium salexigens DSM 2132]